MDLEAVIQSEVSQKEKTNIIYLCKYIESRKNGTDICKAEMEAQMYTTNLWLPSGGREGWDG